MTGSPKSGPSESGPSETGPSETRIMLYILAQLRDRYPQGLWERQNVVAVRARDRFIKAGTKGAGDIRGTWKGRTIELEVKRPGQKQSKAQKTRQQNITAAGGLYAVVHSLDEALAVVENLK